MTEAIDLPTLVRALSDGLDLCVRGRNLDKQIAATIVAERYGEPAAEHMYPETRCFTPALWITDQYDRDLEAWEARCRSMLSMLPEFEP